MPSKIVHFYHYESDNTTRSAVGNTYDAAKYHQLDLLANRPTFQRNAPWRGRLEFLNVQVSSIALATKMYVRISADAAGDAVLIPEAEATIATGITTTTNGAVAYKIQVPLSLQTPGAGDLYLHFRTDAGTVQVDQSSLSWSE